MSRVALHSGSWYSENETELDDQLSCWLSSATTTINGQALPTADVRAIISPHAGYAYSGQAAAYAFKCLQNPSIKRVFILGPSHHVYLRGCALSACRTYETPLGNLTLDHDTMDALTATGHFTPMSQSVDEEEHSIEMQLPYLYKMLKILGKETSTKIVPILVGALSDKREKLYGELLAPYLADHDNFFVISSDFCHWGTRFRYTFYSPDDKPSTYPGNVQDFKVHPLPIYRAIENLDREGMGILETLSYDEFTHYLDVTSNTICGRHPIGVLLCAVEHLRVRPENVALRFVYYAQSSSVKTIRESSVSYASAYLTIAS